MILTVALLALHFAAGIFIVAAVVSVGREVAKRIG